MAVVQSIANRRWAAGHFGIAMLFRYRDALARAADRGCLSCDADEISGTESFAPCGARRWETNVLRLQQG